MKANAPAGPAITVPPSAKDHSKRPALAPSAAAGGEGPVHPAQLKQLELLLAPAKDFEDMIKNMEFSMAKMMKQKYGPASPPSGCRIHPRATCTYL